MQPPPPRGHPDPPMPPEFGNNTTANTSFPQLPPPSAPPLAIMILALGTNLGGGAVGILCNSLVILVIFSNKSLQSPCFELIGGGAIGSLLVAAHYLGRGLDQVSNKGPLKNIQRTSLGCLLTAGIPGVFAFPYHGITTCMVGVDRAISILLPVEYRKFGKLYVIYLLLGSAVLVTALVVTGFLTAPLSEVVSCPGYPSAVHPKFMTAFVAINLIFNLANVMVYGVMLISYWIKKRQYGNTNEGALFLKSQAAAMPTVRMMIVLYFLFGILPELFINVTWQIDPIRYPWINPTKDIGNCLKVRVRVFDAALQTVSRMHEKDVWHEIRRLCIGNFVIRGPVTAKLTKNRL